MELKEIPKGAPFDWGQSSVLRWLLSRGILASMMVMCTLMLCCDSYAYSVMCLQLIFGDSLAVAMILVS